MWIEKIFLGFLLFKSCFSMRLFDPIVLKIKNASWIVCFVISSDAIWTKIKYFESQKKKRLENLYLINEYILQLLDSMES